MKSKLILNLVLLVLVGALAAVAFLEPGKKKPETKPLVALDDKALAQITLKNKDTIVFERQEGHWRLATPFKAPANEIRVRQLIDIVKSKTEAEYPVKPEELAKFELDKPKAVLTLGKATLEFGGSDPINMRRYVRIGETLYLVSDDFSHHLTASATDYVDKKLLPESAKIKEIVLPGLTASLGPDGKWTREPPAEPMAKVNELLMTWNSARAIDVKRLEKPMQGEVIRIGLVDGNPIEFTLVQREPDLLLARQDLGLQYELTGESARQLLNLPKMEAKPEREETEEPGDESESKEDMGEEGGQGEEVEEE